MKGKDKVSQIEIQKHYQEETMITADTQKKGTGNKRADMTYRNLELQKIKCHSYQNLISSFHKEVSQRSEYICTCCDQIWYREMYKKRHVSEFKTKISEKST